MALNASILRDSFALVVERNDRVVARFYAIFFERYPQVRPMFGRKSQDAQERMLTAALAAVIDHVDDVAWLDGTLRGLGRQHVAYGVTEEMYAWVGECLIAALSEVAGADWTPEVEQAWVEAFGAIRDLMLAGAEDADVAEEMKVA